MSHIQGRRICHDCGWRARVIFLPEGVTDFACPDCGQPTAPRHLDDGKDLAAMDNRRSQEIRNE